MLLNDLYTITSTSVSEDTLEAQIKLNQSHRIYEGHFPGQPITPGVVEIQMIKEVLGHHLSKELELDTVGRCKFLSVLDPISNPEFTLKITSKMVDGVIRANAEGFFNDQTFYKVSATYR